VISGFETATKILLPTKYTKVEVGGYGMSTAAKSGYKLSVKILDNSGKEVISKTSALNKNCNALIDVSSMKAGKYTMQVSILDKNGKEVSTMKKNIEAIEGYLYN
jgi:hypothetical protein